MTKNTFIQSIKKIPRAYWFFGIFCFLFTALMVFVEINNGKFWTNDFKVYYDATRDFFSGNDPYQTHYGLSSGYFKYPPTTLYFFGLVSWLPYFTAQLIHTFFLLASLILATSLFHNAIFLPIAGNDSKRYRGILYLAFVFIAIHIVREFHLGNINLMLLFLFVVGLTQMEKSNFTVAIFWSCMVILKPIVILAFIPLLFFKKWRIIVWMAGFGIIFFLVPIVNVGWTGNIALWTNWFNAIGAHGDYIISENSLTYLTNYYLGIKSAWLPSIIALVVLVIFLYLDAIKYQFSKQKILHHAIVLLAFTPNFFVTDTEHFLLSLPLLLLVIKLLVELKNKWFWIPFVLLIIPFSFNSNDLLGRNLSDYFDERGMLGIVNLGFIIFYLILSRHKTPSEATIPN